MVLDRQCISSSVFFLSQDARGFLPICTLQYIACSFSHFDLCASKTSLNNYIFCVQTASSLLQVVTICMKKDQYHYLFDKVFPLVFIA